MRVALVTTDLSNGSGWSTLAGDLGSALVAAGVEVVAVTQSGTAPAAIWQPTDFRPVLPGSTSRRALPTILRANRTVAAAVADCDLVDVIAEPYAACFLSSCRARPVVITACGTFVPQLVQQWPERWWYRRIFRRCSLRAISDYTADQVRRVLGPIEVAVHLPGIPVERWLQPGTVPAKTGPTVISVGAPKPRKGWHLLVEALPAVRAAVPDIQCLLIGGGGSKDYVATLKARIKELDLEPVVRLTGRLSDDDLRGWYQHADLYVQPALNDGPAFEGFGLVHLEANACGLPTIGSLDCGNESAIIDGETGYLVAQGDVPALAARMVEVLSDAQLALRLRQNARHHARQHTCAHYASESLAYYQRKLAEHRQ